jgi:hypothetical protein
MSTYDLMTTGVVSYSTIPWRRYPHGRGKKMGPKGGEP